MDKSVRKSINFIYALAEHCNLNCLGCDHFSPIAGEEFADIESYSRDMFRLSELLNGECEKIGLMGGEPLLNKEIVDFMVVARKAFPRTRIRIVTNGLLLGTMSNAFFDACVNNNIEIEYTKYPIALDYEILDERIKEYGVTISSYSQSEVVKTLRKVPLDISGMQNAEENFYHCMHSNNCIQLKKGRLYTCTVAPNAEHFKKRFNIDMELNDENGIDIHNPYLTKEKIFEFLAKPIPFCRYCDVKGRTEGHEWKQSSGDISEWTN